MRDRTDKIETYFYHQLEALLVRYNPQRPTVILLPGGKGSQLERTARPYPDQPNDINDVIWRDPGVTWPTLDACKLEILKVRGEDRDKDSHVIAPHGPLHFANMTPYARLKEFADKETWNYVVFGFDWRRPLAESSAFLKRFIRRFQSTASIRFREQRSCVTAWAAWYVPMRCSISSSAVSVSRQS